MRADLLLVRQGLADSRERAQRLIMAGRVTVGTTTLVKPATLLDESTVIAVAEPERYVSRGGLKLEAALERFGTDVTGLRCLDIGASTGGFTDCLLQHGAASVLAVDVGRAQLHQRLREDDRVTLREGINARSLPELPPIGFFVADVSFISLRKILPSVAERTAPGTPGVVLLKPQFEAGPSDVPRGGVIRDGSVRKRILEGFAAWAEGESWKVSSTMDCPVSGARGNVEFLLSLSTPATTEAGS
jgi:23S rRNA (cytidine1920-2'-O)/16S rRNA (cytidine1409-2'-O)-methyltransferase